MLTLSCCALIATIAAAPLTVTAPNTRTGHCWWVCADVICRTRGDDRHLLQKAILTGLDSDRFTDIEQVVPIWPIPTLAEARERTTAGEHVIATLRWPGGLHAVVMVDAVPGRAVVFWNPNDPSRYESLPADEFARRWVIGTMVVK